VLYTQTLPPHVERCSLKVDYRQVQPRWSERRPSAGYHVFALRQQTSTGEKNPAV